MENIEIWKYKNFNMSEELDIAGEFIYDGIHTMNQIDAIDQKSRLFSFLYHISVGIERLQKIVLVLIEDIDIENYDEFEKSLISHSHLELNRRICDKTKLEMGERENTFLQMLSNFYKTARYQRFNLQAKVKQFDEEERISSFIEKYLTQEKLTYHFVTNKLLFTDSVKELFGRVIGRIVKKYYNFVKDISRSIDTYTYELLYGSKAEKVFGYKRPKQSLQTGKVDERIVLKELLIYLRNSKEKSPFINYIDTIEPLDLDKAMINEYIYEVCKGYVPQHLIDEVECIYEENEYSVERIELVDAVGDIRVYFDLMGVHEYCSLLECIASERKSCEEFIESFDAWVVDYDGEYEEIFEVIEKTKKLCVGFKEQKIQKEEFIRNITAYYNELMLEYFGENQ